ncbi:hypothetical protein HOY80DRAFT_1004129 [Tuber brumale]|nr:hypothetical protein HOY80DRAFT_1004129 [Tuber brumale]
MAPGKRLSISIKGAIIALRICAKMSYLEISTCLEIDRETVRKIFACVEGRCANEEQNIRAMLATVELGDRKRSDPAVPEKYPPGSDESNQIHLSIVPGLTQSIESFVFSDEMIFEVEVPRRLRNITRHKREDPYTSAVPDKAKSDLSIMVSRIISHGFKGLLWVWISETEEERKGNNEELEQENRERADR